jgi:FkbM family methyltransferase
MQRHQTLHRIANAAYYLPGGKALARIMTRFAIQSFPLSLKNKQRLYNFVGEATAPGRELLASTHDLSSGPISFKVDLRDDLSRMWYYWGYSSYESATVRLFCRLLKTKFCVLDVGANIGYYTLLAAKALEGRGEVHAFEPCPRVFRWLSENARLNGLSCLTLNQTAVSDANGSQPLFFPADKAGTNASLIENFTVQGSSIVTSVLCLDTYCANKVKRPVDLLKVDVEGAELNVLRGSRSLLQQQRPDIICEVLEPFDDELNKFFRETPYGAFLITDSGLLERQEIRADPQFRDYYLTCRTQIEADGPEALQ